MCMYVYCYAQVVVDCDIYVVIVHSCLIYLSYKGVIQSQRGDWENYTLSELLIWGHLSGRGEFSFWHLWLLTL